VREACADQGGVEVDTQGTPSSSPSPRHLAHSRRPRRSRSGSRVGQSWFYAADRPDSRTSTAAELP
jgi:hypothetical protein